MAHDVFISYVSTDRKAADTACAILEKNKIRCWIAPRDVLPGVKWAKAIVDAISNSRLMVLILSSRSNDSTHVMSEVELAVHRGIPILPLRIEDVVPSGEMEFFLSATHWLDALTPPFEAHLERLASTVKTLLCFEESSPKSTNTPLVAPEEEPSRPQAETSAPNQTKLPNQEASNHVAPTSATKPSKSGSQVRISEKLGPPPTASTHRIHNGNDESNAANVPKPSISTTLNHWLSSSDESLRLQAVEEIGKRQIVEKAKVLAKMVRQDERWRIRAQALVVLRQLRQKKPEVFGPWYIELLNSAVASTGPDDPRPKGAKVYVVYGPSSLHREALKSLIEIGEDASGILASYMPTMDVDLRSGAIQYIRNGGHVSQIRLLAELAQGDEKWQIRAEALYGLRTLRENKPEQFGPWYPELLRSATESTGPNDTPMGYKNYVYGPSILRRSALTGLKQIGEDVSEILASWIASKDVEFRFDAVRCIGENELFSQIETLANLVRQDEKWQIRNEALTVLRTLRKKKPVAFGPWYPDLLVIAAKSTVSEESASAEPYAELYAKKLREQALEGLEDLD